ncbi:MAG: flagellar basal body-associated FliL family protein [Deltaproteobacteria bacterium]|nr:flagellar basal body-associated FliL family protein [Deltaproteobacteria bacterium]
MNKKLMIIIIAAVVVVLGGGATAFFLLSGKKASVNQKDVKKEAKVEKKEGEATKDEGNKDDKKEAAKSEDKKEESKEAKNTAPEVNKEELPSKEEKGAEEEFSYQMDSIVANIFDKNSIHYLKLGVQVRASNQEVIDELKSKKPQLKDKLLFILSDVSMREVLTSGGKALLQEDIQDAFNRMLKKGKVTKVYYTEFTVQ